MNRELRDALARYREADLTQQAATQAREAAKAALREALPERAWVEVMGYRVLRDGERLDVRRVD